MESLSLYLAHGSEAAKLRALSGRAGQPAGRSRGLGRFHRTWNRSRFISLTAAKLQSFAP
jgi:hypothetical protein